MNQFDAKYKTQDEVNIENMIAGKEKMVKTDDLYYRFDLTLQLNNKTQLFTIYTTEFPIQQKTLNNYVDNICRMLNEPIPKIIRLQKEYGLYRKIADNVYVHIDWAK